MGNGKKETLNLFLARNLERGIKLFDMEAKRNAEGKIVIDILAHGSDERDVISFEVSTVTPNYLKKAYDLKEPN